MCDIEDGVVGLFNSVGTSGVYTTEFHFLDHFVEDVRRSGVVLVLDASAYK